MKKHILTLFILNLISLISIAQSVRHVFMSYDVRYSDKSATIDSLSDENVVIINDYPISVTEIPIANKSVANNEALYFSLFKKNNENNVKDLSNIEYPTSAAYPSEENYTKYINGNHNNISTSNSFVPALDTFGGYYYRIDAAKGKNKFGLGFAPNGVYYQHKKTTYYITLAVGTTHNKIIIFRVEKDKLAYVNQFGVPGNGFQNSIPKKKKYLSGTENADYLTSANHTNLTILKNGSLLIPINIKEGNLKGIMTIDLNNFLTKYPYNEKVEDKAAFVKVLGSHLDETKNTTQEFINAVAPFGLLKIWITTNTAKIILLDTRYPSRAFLYDMNADTIPSIKEKREALIARLKENYDAQYINNSLPKGTYEYNYFSANDWKQIKNAPANIGKYKNCYSKNKSSKCPYFPSADVEKNKFMNEYLLKQLYNGKNKISIKNPRDTANQLHTIQQSLAVDEDGAVYVVTNFEIAKFSYNKSSNQVNEVWSKNVSNSFVAYPGNSNTFNGTAPTLFGNYVAITDKTFPSVHINVFNKTTGKLSSQQTLFENTYSSCDNAVIAYSSKTATDSTLHTLIVNNNFGNAYPLDEVSYTQGGLEKYYFSENETDKKQFEKLVADKKFNNTTKANYIDAKTATPTLNIHNNGVVYLYNQQKNESANNQYPNWQLQAVDFTSGNPIYSVIPSIKEQNITENISKKVQKAIGKKNYKNALFNNLHGNFTQTPKGDFVIPVVRGLVFIPNQSK